MSDREIYSYRDSLADLVALLKNGQRGIDEGSGDWVVKDYSGVSHAMLRYKHWSGSAWVYDPITLGQITLSGVTANRILTTNGSSVITAATLNDIGAQPIDGDLTAISALTGTGVAVRSADNTWLLRTISVMGNGIAAMNGNGIAGNPTIYLDIGTSSTQVAAGNHNHGTGTVNYLTKWSNTTGGLASSLLFDSGSSVGLGTASPSSLLHLNSTSSLWLSLENDTVGTDLFQIGLTSAGKATFRSNHSGFEFLGIPYLGQPETAVFGVSANNIIIGYPSYINYSRTDLYGTVAVDAIYFDRTNLTVSNLTTAKVTDLTDAGDTSLHYHSADRDRGNHTGSQAISTITGLQTALDGKLSGSGTAGRVPYFTSGSALGNSNLYFGSRSLRLMAAPSIWGSSFATIEIGLNALWTNYSVQNGFGLTMSSNIYHDGTGQKPYVNGLAVSYSQDSGTHSWTSDQNLVAGAIFTPTERMRLDFNGLFLQSLNASRAVVTNSSGYLISSSVTSTQLGYLSGVTSAIQTQLNGKVSTWGLGLSGRIPYFYSGTQLANSLLYCSSRGIRFNQEPSNWGSSYSAMEFGANAIWGYTNVIDGYPLHISNNRYNDGTGDKPHVSGGSVTYTLYDRTHRWCIDTGLTAGVAFTPTDRMMLSTSGLYLHSLTADTVLTANANKTITSSSVTSTELGYLSGVTSAIQTQLNGKLSGSGTTGLIPYFTSSGAVGAAKCQYSPSQEQFLWYTSANSELMRLVDEFLWLNTKLVCNGISTGDTGYISMSTSTYTIDVGALTQQNIKISSSTSTTLYLYKARIGTLIYLTNIGDNQINVSYDHETSGPKYTLYPGETMQLLCVNVYGTGNQSCTWAIWRTEVYTGAHLDD